MVIDSVSLSRFLPLDPLCKNREKKTFFLKLSSNYFCPGPNSFLIFSKNRARIEWKIWDGIFGGFNLFARCQRTNLLASRLNSMWLGYYCHRQHHGWKSSENRMFLKFPMNRVHCVAQSQIDASARVACNSEVYMVAVTYECEQCKKSPYRENSNM